VIRGARATLNPSLIPCFKVWVITRVRSGPGASPEDMPRMEPAINDENIFTAQKTKREAFVLYQGYTPCAGVNFIRIADRATVPIIIAPSIREYAFPERPLRPLERLRRCRVLQRPRSYMRTLYNNPNPLQRRMPS